MSKTELTRKIEQAILGWHPAKSGDVTLNTVRGDSTALEVVVDCGTTGGGIVDAVRVSEYFGDKEKRRTCWLKYLCNICTDVGCFDCPLKYDQAHLPKFCDQTDCRWNRCLIVGQQKILITCFEIKVSVPDFKSAHGHNFVGNHNYYVVPKEIFEKIAPLVPDGIGILVFYDTEKFCGLRTKRKPTFLDMTDEDQKWMILSVLKRMRRTKIVFDNTQDLEDWL